MNYILCFIGILFVSLFSQGQTTLLQEVRESYFSGWTGDCGATALSEKLKGLDLSGEMAIMAYRGAVESTLANCASTPWKKMEHFNAGKKEIEKAVESEPDNLEIRVIRFSVQSNIPAFLDYDNIETDKQFILKTLSLHLNLPDHDEFLFTILKFMMSSSKLTEQEKTELKNLSVKN